MALNLYVVVDDAEFSEGGTWERIGLVGGAVQEGACRNLPLIGAVHDAGNRGSQRERPPL
jgi:hypothetical protein